MFHLKKHLSTAGMVCAIRGALAYDDDYPLNELFRDKYAATLCGQPWQLAFLFPPVTLSLLFLLYRKVIPGSAVIILRAYYMEGELEKFVDGGGKQYVLVAAGMDSFLLRKRSLADKISVFEVDLPDIQKQKKDRLKSLGCQVPQNYRFVEADLFSQSLVGTLEKSHFDVSKPAFYSLMGLIYYLPKASFLKMMKDIADHGAAGSVVVFDYLLDDASLDEGQKKFKQACSEEVSSCGEDFCYETSTEVLESEITSLGFKKVSMHEIQDLYASTGLKDHPTAGPNCFALAMFTLSSKTETGQKAEQKT